MNFISPNNMMASMATLWVWALIISLLILVGYLIGTWNHDYFTKRNTPCLKTLPFLGNSGPIFFGDVSISEYMQDIYNRLRGYKYGGVFEFMKPVLFLRDPTLINLVTVKDFEYFVDHHSQFSEVIQPLIGKSLYNLQGQTWKEMRATLSPAFMSSNIKNIFVSVVECGAQLGEFLKQCMRDKNMKIKECRIERDGNILQVEMKDLFARYVNDVIATSAFGVKCDSFRNPSNKFYKMRKEMTDFSRFRLIISLAHLFCPWLIKILKIKLISDRVRNFFYSLVKDAMANCESKGIIHANIINLLMEAKKGKVKNEENNGTNGTIIKPKWDDDEFAAQAMFFLFAGFDTVSTLLCFASYQLAVNPDIQTRLQDEIDQHLKENAGKVTYEAVHSMIYLDMVVSETLRLYPPIAFTDRKCVKNYTFPTKSSYTLNPGDELWIPIYAIHRDPRFFTDPDIFDPERFNNENKEKIKPFTYMPFGLGPRKCIGSRFALMETKIVLIQLLSEFNFKVISKTPIPIQITKKTLNMAIDGGFWLGLEDRIIN